MGMRATCPDISALPQIAELFGITTDELLGVSEKEKRKEIMGIIRDSEEMANEGEVENAIVKLREALGKYPNNEHLLCCLCMYCMLQVKMKNCAENTARR